MKQWIKIVLWSVFVIGIIVTGISIKGQIDKQITPEPEVIIHVEGENAFLTNEELMKQLDYEKLYNPEMLRASLNIPKIERFIQNIPQVKEVDVYQQLNGNWKIDVTLRAPIARIYPLNGESYYIDEEGTKLPKIAGHTARTLVFSGNIKEKLDAESYQTIINNDSLKSIRKLDDIYRISDYVCNDPLFHSLLGQVHLKSNGDFVLVPLVGDQRIIFGSAYSEEEVAQKFKKLRIFYEEALPHEGWNTYTEISLKFKDQVVCKKR